MPLTHRLTDEFWSSGFIRLGMMQYCYALLEGMDAPKSIHYLEPESELQRLLALQGFNSGHSPKLALTVGSPDLLRLLSQYLIFKELQGAGMVELVLGHNQGPGPLRLTK